MDSQRKRGRPRVKNGQSVSLHLRINRDLLQRLDEWRGETPRIQAIRLAIERLVKTKRPLG